MDWALCVVCQQCSNEVLRCPLNGPGSADKSGPYRSFLSRVCTFRDLDLLPVPLSHLTEHVTVDDMVSNEAKWHKSCLNKFGHDRLDRAQKRKGAEIEAESSVSSAKRVCPPRQLLDKSKCIFCEEANENLHQFCTLQSDTNVRNMARDLQDASLLAKIEGGDLIALEARYHLTCLVNLHNRHRLHLREIQNASSTESHDERKMEARAFVELLTYIESSVEEGNFLYKFSELRSLYESRLIDFGISKQVNKVRFKDQVLSHFPEAQAQSDGKNAILVFEKGMQQILKQAFNCNYEDDALVLSKAANIVREDIRNSTGFQFSGSFFPDCQQDSVPTNLKYLVSMLLNGSSIKDQDSAESQSSLSISQAILFNCRKKSVKTSSRHSKIFEPPLPLYIGLKVHTQTRSKKLISELYQLGLSVSYDRILELEKQIASSCCEQTNEIGLVCPRQLKHGLFTAGALDNLDHNPSRAECRKSSGHCYIVNVRKM